MSFAENFIWEVKSGFSAHNPQKTTHLSCPISWVFFFSYSPPQCSLGVPSQTWLFLLPETIKMLTKANDHMVRKTLFVRNEQLCNSIDFFLSYIITKRWLLHTSRYKNLEITDSLKETFPTLILQASSSAPYFFVSM